ncbi:hypothetical protein LXL04_010949 [Taraxacum kok-saghyz]
MSSELHLVIVNLQQLQTLALRHSDNSLTSPTTSHSAIAVSLSLSSLATLLQHPEHLWNGDFKFDPNCISNSFIKSMADLIKEELQSFNKSQEMKGLQSRLDKSKARHQQELLTKMNDEGESSSNDVGAQSSLMTGSSRRRIDNRMRFYETSEGNSLNREIVSEIAELLPIINEYVRVFKTSKELSDSMNLQNFSIRLYTHVPDRTSLPPEPGTLGGIVFGDDINANEYDIIVHSKDGGRLFQQFLVDAYVCIEEGRLDFIRNNQDKFRSDFVVGVYDALSRGDIEGNAIGQKIKVENFIKFMKEDKTFGDVSAFLYTIEFQKRVSKRSVTALTLTEMKGNLLPVERKKFPKKSISQNFEAIGNFNNCAHKTISSSRHKLLHVVNFSPFKYSAFPNMYSKNSRPHFCPLKYNRAAIDESKCAELQYPIYKFRKAIQPLKGMNIVKIKNPIVVEGAGVEVEAQAAEPNVGNRGPLQYPAGTRPGDPTTESLDK